MGSGPGRIRILPRNGASTKGRGEWGVGPEGYEYYPGMGPLPRGGVNGEWIRILPRNGASTKGWGEWGVGPEGFEPSTKRL